MDLRNILVLIAALTNLVIGLMVHARSERTSASRYFEVTIYFIVAWCLAMFMYRAAPMATINFWARVLYFFPTFIPAGFVLFGLHFPNRKILKSLQLRVLGISGFVMVLCLIPGVIISEVELLQVGEPIIKFGWGYYLLYIPYIVAYFSWAIWIHVQKYKGAEGYRKAQLRYILIGLIIASAGGMLNNLLMPTMGYFELNWMGQVATFALIAPVAYAIVKHRLMDIRVVVARTISYSMLLLILTGVYAALLFLLASVILPGQVSSTQFWVSIVLAMVLAYTFQPLRRLLEHATGRVFFKGKYDSQVVLSSASHIMTSTYELDRLINDILQMLTNQVRIRRAGVFLMSEEHIDHVKLVGFEGELPALTHDQIMRLMGKGRRHPMLIFDEMEEGARRDLMREMGFDVVIPLVTKDATMGLLALGDKSSGDVYSEQDIKLFEILAPELSIAVQNAKAFQEISKFNVTLRQEVKKATGDLRIANKRLQQLDKLKDEFVSVASHELRTPMTAIKSYLWMILNNEKKSEDHFTDKTKEYLERAYTSTERLINLVNDMLDVSRIEAGRVELSLDEVSMADLADEVMHEVSANADERGLEVVVEGADDLPSVKADKDKIHQVLINLVGNALKFTERGGKITVGFETKSDFVVVHVRDTGKGISKEDQAKLFSKFGRLEHSMVSVAEAGGTGLGLYICKQLVDMHGGRIWVESEKGNGSTFSFQLPIYK